MAMAGPSVKWPMIVTAKNTIASASPRCPNANRQTGRPRLPILGNTNEGRLDSCRHPRQPQSDGRHESEQGKASHSRRDHDASFGETNSSRDESGNNQTGRADQRHQIGHEDLIEVIAEAPQTKPAPEIRKTGAKSAASTEINSIRRRRNVRCNAFQISNANRVAQ